MHSPSSPVRIFNYSVSYGDGDAGGRRAEGEVDGRGGSRGGGRGGIGTVLTGAVHFTARSESYSGYCHGGSMCSAMDDVIGWTSFLTTGECLPWSGFTAQINTSLKRPVAVDSYLTVKGTITRIEGRKVWIEAVLFDPTRGEGEDIVYATAEGMAVLRRGILPDP